MGPWSEREGVGEGVAREICWWAWVGMGGGGFDLRSDVSDDVRCKGEVGGNRVYGLSDFFV